MTLTTQCVKIRIQKGLGLPFAVQMLKPSDKPNSSLNRLNIFVNRGIFFINLSHMTKVQIF